MTDEQWAYCGRALADALMKFAHERGAAEKKRVSELQTELCRERRQEIQASQVASPDTVPAESAPRPAKPSGVDGEAVP